MISPCAAIGNSSHPLAGLVLHFGEAGTSSLPCEAAWISRLTDFEHHGGGDPPLVHVYVSPSSLRTMKAAYQHFGPNVTVSALQFTESELDAKALLSMMSVGGSESAPLYMQIVLVRKHQLLRFCSL